MEKEEKMSTTIIGIALENDIEITEEVKALASAKEQNNIEKERNSFSFKIKQSIKDNIPKIVSMTIVIIGSAICKYFDIPILEFITSLL